MPTDRTQLPCWSCDKPQAIDVWLRQCSDNDVEQQCSPSGLPLCCCRVRIVGVVRASDTTRATM